MRTHASTRLQAADRYFTSSEVGELLQVAPGSVNKWINEGLLEAFRTPGGHRRISATELVRFSLEQGMPIPDGLQDLAVSNVLVVDDEPRFLASIERAFKPYRDELRIHTADNGIDALVLIGSLK